MSAVVITRGWGGTKAAVDEEELTGLHIAGSAGGTGATLPRPTVAGYILCNALPPDVAAEFGHSCQHGPPPHRIKVLVPKGPNDRAVYERLRALASR
jgi:hypothetical protein